MMAQYHTFLLSPEQLGMVGTIYLIIMAGVVLFNLQQWLRPPTDNRGDDRRM